MFRNWGFLITEMVGLLLLAALLGLFVGWVIWARRRTMIESHSHSDDGRAAKLEAELNNCRAKHSDKDARIAQLEAELAMANRAASAAAAAPAPVAPAAVAVSVTKAAAAGDEDDVDYDGDGVIEGTNEGTRPEALSGPRGGKADDLKRIKGIGPKLEVLCHTLGFYHFDQVANWTADEVAWVNANLEGFKGRVSRDNWVEQAKVLAAGGETEFSRRVDGGNMY